MSSSLTQIVVLTRANLGSVPRRIWISLSMVLSVALVVGVLLGFLAMAQGFEKALAGTGSPTVAVVLGGGSSHEVGSEIPLEEIRKLAAVRGDIGIRRDRSDGLLVSRELVVPVDARRAATGMSQSVSLRGMDAAGVSLRASVRLVAGRSFQPGARELVVGTGVARDYDGFGIGDQIAFGTAQWTVVGHFDAGGSVFDSEIWADIQTVQADFDRIGQVMSLRAGISGPEDIETLQAFFDANAAVPLQAVSEQAFYAAQSGRTAGLIRMFGWPLAVLMAIGATAGALNTMMSSVSDRAVEIATVRSLGFSRLPAFTATWIEAIVLSLAGAAVGITTSLVLFNGWQATTTGTNNTSLAFALTVTPDLMLQAAALAFVIGLIGGGLPAFHAARLPLKAALRSRG